MTLIDTELKQLAALALHNDFYTAFSALVNKYVAAADGLDGDQTDSLGNLTSVYGRDYSASSDEDLNIWTQNSKTSMFSTTGHQTMLAALEHEQAVEVHLNGKIRLMAAVKRRYSAGHPKSANSTALYDSVFARLALNPACPMSRSTFSKTAPTPVPC